MTSVLCVEEQSTLLLPMTSSARVPGWISGNLRLHSQRPGSVWCMNTPPGKPGLRCPLWAPNLFADLLHPFTPHHPSLACPAAVWGLGFSPWGTQRGLCGDSSKEALACPPDSLSLPFPISCN